MKRQYAVLYAVMLMLALISGLGGCSALDPQVESPHEQVKPAANLANGYILLAQVRLMTAEALKQGLLSVDEGKQMLHLTDTARQTLDAARTAHFNGQADAANKGMDIAGVVLSQIYNTIEFKRNQKAKGGGK